MLNKGHNNAGSNGLSGHSDPSPAGTPSKDNADDEIDLKKLFSLLYGYKWFILAVTLGVTVASYFYARSVTPIYQGEATMIVSQNSASNPWSGGDLSGLLSSSFGIGMPSTMGNELEVLRSRRLTEQLADQLLASPSLPDGTVFPVLWRDYPEDPNIVRKDTLINRLQRNLSIERKDRESDVIRIHYTGPSPSEVATISNMVMDTYMLFSIDQNRNQTRSALDFLNHEMVNVEQTLIEKEEILRDFMNQEKLVQLDSQTQELITAMSQLQSERQSVSVREVATRSAIESYRSELERIRPGFAEKYAEGIFSRLNRFQFQLAELETEKMLLLQRNPSLEANPRAEPAYQRLTQQIEDLRSEITRLAGDFIENDDHSLGMLSSSDGNLAGRVTEMRQELMKLEIDAQQYQAQAEVLDNRLAEYQQFFDNLPDNMIDFARIQRDITVNEHLFLTISQQAAELAVWEQTQTSMGRVVDYSIVPKTPIKPRVKLMVVIGFVLGGMLSLGLVFLREITNTRVNSIDKLKERNYPLLAVIPDNATLKKKLFPDQKRVDTGEFHISTDLLTVLDSMSYLSEAYRRLLNNILYSQPDQPFQTILVSSPNKSEGKSTLIANLAVTMAEAGKKVLILDCDLRRPKQHKLWGLPASPGLVDVLFDKPSFEQVIQSTLIENLKVMTGGTKSPNPAAVIQSNRMLELIDELKGRYDIVLIDSPPFGIITDAAPLIQCADGIVLATRFNQTHEAELDQCIENLRNVRANIIGTVISAYDYKKAGGSQYSSSYHKYAYNSYNRYQEEN